MAAMSAPEMADSWRDRLRRNPAARYFAASLIALVADYALTMCVYTLAGIDLSSASAISFVTVGLLFYLVHEFWTFREDGSRFSAKRMVANMGVLCVAGAVRVAIIAALELARSPEGLWVSLYFAAGVAGSFTTNYVLNRYFVFRR